MVKTEQITCPVCGKQHQVKPVTNVKVVCLDMTPQYNMQDIIDAHVLCECGMLCFNNVHTMPQPHNLVQLPRYQEALSRKCDDVERKFYVMTYGLQYQWAPIYAVHYYQQIGDVTQQKKWLNIALQRTQEGYDYNTQTAHASRFACLRSKKTFFDDSFLYTTQHKLLELYRQLGDFAKADEYCQALLSQCKSSQEQKFLAYECKLIAQKDSTIH